MSSTPAYLNPPSFPFSLENLIADQAAQEQRLKLFLSSSVPYGAASCSLSFPAFFDSLHDQSGISGTTTTVGDQGLLYNQTANKSIWQGETSYDQICSSSSSDHPVFGVCNDEYHKLSLCTDQVIETSKFHESQNRQVKWTPSRKKLMQKMTHESDQGPENNRLTYKFQSARPDDQYREINTGETSSNSSLTVSSDKSRRCSLPAVRICSDCNTSTTPLWRSGPRGPKSLCNACGIRQRKERRSMAEAAAASATGCGTACMATSTARSSSMYKGEEKKSQQNHNVNVTVSCKKKGKLIMADDSTNTSEPSKHYKRNDKQLCNFKQLVATFPSSVLFPGDVEAAIMLMDLSSGLVPNHS